jgi:hypothetical protein
MLWRSDQSDARCTYLRSGRTSMESVAMHHGVGAGGVPEEALRLCHYELEVVHLFQHLVFAAPHSGNVGHRPRTRR